VISFVNASSASISQLFNPSLGLGVDADDLAELVDEHHLGGVVDEVDGGDFADFGGVFM